MEQLGFEIHAQLKTALKIFYDCSTDYGANLIIINVSCQQNLDTTGLKYIWTSKYLLSR